MYLSKVVIENFRCFRNFELSLEAGLNVVAGRNNTGKSNLLAAIRHALGPSASRSDSLWLTADDFFRESASEDPETTIRITLTFADLTERQRAQFFEIVDFDLSDLTKSKAIVRFEASLPKGRRNPITQRWGGPESSDRSQIPSELLEALPVTFLPALRDAESALMPGHRSRLAALLRDLADRGGDSEKEAIESIFKEANTALEGRDLIKGLRTKLQQTTETMAGSDYAESTIRTSGVDFDRILRTLRVEMSSGPLPDLSANGLGYNNLLYMAVVLEHLKSEAADESPLLLVEEPEAHLHPQLVILLAQYLANEVPGGSRPQTIVTTHSPVFATCVKPSQMRLMRTSGEPKAIRGVSLAERGLNDREEREIQRLLDATRASLYFAKGVVLVEGISEVLLLPVLATALGHNLAANHVSVIPLCGVAFGTLEKLLQDEALGIPVVIVTDADPPTEKESGWTTAYPRRDGAGFAVSARVVKLEKCFAMSKTVKVIKSKVTLEYDLAEAAASNADAILTAWSQCFEGKPRTFNQELLDAAGSSAHDRALCVWRGICRADHSGSKAELAHRLADLLATAALPGATPVDFEVPVYIVQAIEHIMSATAGPQGLGAKGGQG